MRTCVLNLLYFKCIYNSFCSLWAAMPFILFHCPQLCCIVIKNALWDALRVKKNVVSSFNCSKQQQQSFDVRLNVKASFGSSWDTRRKQFLIYEKWQNALSRSLIFYMQREIEEVFKSEIESSTALHGAMNVHTYSNEKPSNRHSFG